MDLDIDIRNYNLNDILKLFSIPVAFSEEHLKSAKRTVLKMHPDKCALPKEYFLFFTKAYRILYQIYSMRHERAQGYGHVQKYAELIADGESAACSAETLGCESATTTGGSADHRAKLAKMSHGEFNRWFNSAFEKYRVPDSAEDEGYEQATMLQITTTTTTATTATTTAAAMRAGVGRGLQPKCAKWNANVPEYATGWRL
jgi:hypothetical protein